MILIRRFPDSYYNIPFTLIFVFLIMLIPCLLFFPANKGIASAGSISGTVRRYSTNTEIANIAVTVEVFNKNFSNWVTVKSTQTESNGTYKIDSLDPGKYKVYTLGMDYIAECYQSGCTGKNCGITILHDPNGSLLTLKSGENLTNINFYLCRGAEIKGHIYNIIENAPVKVVIEGEIKYKQSPTISIIDDEKLNNPLLFAFADQNNNYSIFQIPPGDYKIKIRDSYVKNNTFNTDYRGVTEHRNYCVIYYNNKYLSSTADIITLTIDNPVKHNIDFYLSKGGIVYGNLKDYLDPNKHLDKGIVNGAKVIIKENNLGFTKDYISGDAAKINPNDPNNPKELKGFYYLSGLPPGSYILEVQPIFPTCGVMCERFLIEFYDNAYSESSAKPITVSKGAQIKIDIILDRYPAVSGWVIEGDPDSCYHYDPNKALEGIEVKVTGPYPNLPKSVYTDEEGKYILDAKNFTRVGSYYVKAQEPTQDPNCIPLVDPNCVPDPDYARDPNNYYISDRSDYINLKINTKYEINFCLEKATGIATHTISGYVFLNENTNIPIPNVNIFAFDSGPRTSQGVAETDVNGRFAMEVPEATEYVIFTSSIDNPMYNDLTKEVYNDIAILDPDFFPEGSTIINKITENATFVDVSYGEHVTGINFGLSSYKYSFEKGLNLFGYPGEPVEKYDTSYELCSLFGANLNSFRWKDPDTQQWKVTKPNPSNPANMTGDNFKIQLGQGYLIYMNNNIGNLFYPPFKNNFQGNHYGLFPGKNFASYPVSINSLIKNSHDLISAIGNQSDGTTVHCYDKDSGTWLSSVWLWGEASGQSFSITKGTGYWVDVKVAKNFIP